jgi:hypothetical protein
MLIINPLSSIIEKVIEDIHEKNNVYDKEYQVQWESLRSKRFQNLRLRTYLGFQADNEDTLPQIQKKVEVVAPNEVLEIFDWMVRCQNQFIEGIYKDVHFSELHENLSIYPLVIKIRDYFIKELKVRKTGDVFFKDKLIWIKPGGQTNLTRDFSPIPNEVHCRVNVECSKVNGKFQIGEVIYNVSPGSYVHYNACSENHRFIPSKHDRLVLSLGFSRSLYHLYSLPHSLHKLDEKHSLSFINSVKEIIQDEEIIHGRLLERCMLYNTNLLSRLPVLHESLFDSRCKVINPPFLVGHSLCIKLLHHIGLSMLENVPFQTVQYNTIRFRFLQLDDFMPLLLQFNTNLSNIFETENICTGHLCEILVWFVGSGGCIQVNGIDHSRRVIVTLLLHIEGNQTCTIYRENEFFSIHDGRFFILNESCSYGVCPNNTNGNYIFLQLIYDQTVA